MADDTDSEVDAAGETTSIEASSRFRSFVQWWSNFFLQCYNNWQFLAWIFAGMLVLRVMVELSQHLDPRIVLSIIVLSSIFPILAVYYRRFLTEETRDRSREFKQYVYQSRFSGELNKHASEDDDSKEKLVNELRDTYHGEYGGLAYSFCVLPAVTLSLIGWSILLVPLGAEETVEPETTLGAVLQWVLPRPTVTETPDSNRSVKDWVADLTNGLVNLGLGIDISKSSARFSGASLNMPPKILAAMGVGFLGSLVFCFQLLWQRLTTEDLKPSIFLRCALAMFSAMTFNYIVFSASVSFANGFDPVAKPADASLPSTEGLTGTNALLGYIIAFSLGYFPMLAIRWFTRVAHDNLGEPARRADSQRLSSVDGITLFHEERLLEEGIQTVHDLAYSDIGRLLIKTPYTTRQLTDWVDQSLFLLFISPVEIESFRRGGVRTAIDLTRVWAPMIRKEVADPLGPAAIPGNDGGADGGQPPPAPKAVTIRPTEDERRARALAFSTTPERLDAIYLALQPA